jgi:lipoprotein NlpD
MRRLAVSLAVLCLAGCLTTPPGPVPQAEGRVHVVQRGDTLYNIAFRYGLDHRDLARWNRIDNPNLIHVGQRVRLSPPSGAPAARSSAPASPAPAPSSGGTSSSAPAPRPAPLPSPPVLPPPAWQWPTQGRVVSAFGSQSGGISSGIAISGQAGQPIHAAASGRVVYAGTGLIGYGQLVIIMHNDTYLSAYGYNARLLVAQGQGVERGEAIAEMGTGPDREPRLHFEIRRNGVPVDPLPYLQPRR